MQRVEEINAATPKESLIGTALAWPARKIESFQQRWSYILDGITTILICLSCSTIISRLPAVMFLLRHCLHRWCEIHRCCTATDKAETGNKMIRCNRYSHLR